MKILSTQEISHCNLSRQTEEGLEYLPGVSYQNKLYFIDTFFSPAQKQEALKYCRTKFLDGVGHFPCILTEDETGFSVWAEDKRLNLIDIDETLNIVEQIELQDLATKMRNIHGVGIKDRRYLLKIYTKCFVGSEAVTWMRSNFNLSTEQAIELGQRLIDESIIHHVLNQHQFANEFLFYRFYCDES